jgi:HEAT repeat protein
VHPIEAGGLQWLALNENAPMESRLDAVTLLTAMKEPDDEGLQKLFVCGDRTIFIETLKSIKTFGVPWALAHLIAAAKASEDPAQRAVFAWALAAYPDSSEAETVLLDTVTHDSSPTVREHAIESLGEFRSDAVIETLVRRQLFLWIDDNYFSRSTTITF